MGDFLDRVTIQPEEVYRRFETEIPKTSTPAPADIMALFDRIAAEGYTHVIAVTFPRGFQVPTTWCAASHPAVPICSAL